MSASPQLPEFAGPDGAGSADPPAGAQASIRRQLRIIARPGEALPETVDTATDTQASGPVDPDPVDDQGFQRQLLDNLRHSPPLDDHIQLGGRRLLNLASNNYLGLTRDPRVIAAAVQAVCDWGTGSGSSPLLSGYTTLHQTMADAISHWKSGGSRPGSHSAAGETSAHETNGVDTLLFSSGYAANLAVLGTLLEEDAQVFADRRNHASLVDGLRLAQQRHRHLQVRHYRHRDYRDLRRLLEQSDPRRPRWIVTDSVFSMDGTCCEPADLAELVRPFPARVIVDEAHATGVLGHNGSGLFGFSATDPDRQAFRAEDGSWQLLVVGTLSKALASSGGFVCGPSRWIDRLVQQGRPLIYSTSLSAASVAAGLAAVQIAANEPHHRQRLQQHVSRLHHELRAQGWQTTGDLRTGLLGVVVGPAERATELERCLMERGIWAPAIRPPTVRPLECRLRLSPTATMSDAEIGAVISAFAEIRERDMETRVGRDNPGCLEVPAAAMPKDLSP